MSKMKFETIATINKYKLKIETKKLSADHVWIVQNLHSMYEMYIYLQNLSQPKHKRSWSIFNN